MVRSVASLAFIAFLTFTSSQPASAHERREVGKYTLVVGWNSEPALEGETNAISLRVFETTSNKGVEGLEQAVRVSVTYGGSVKTFEPALRAVRGTPGSYIADIVPTRAGDYTFRFQGKVEGREIDERFESGPQRFDSIKSQEDLQFPDRVGSSSELARQIRGAVDYAETTRTFFIGALALSAMAALLAAAALVQVRRRRVIRVALILVTIVTGLALSAQPASAHATYVRSNPAADARLQRAPSEVRVSWSEEVDARFSEIQVLDPSGRAMHEGRVQPGDDTSSLRVALRAISEGGYTVSWRVLSSVDGHETRGSFVFAIGDAPLPTLAIEDPGGGRTPTPLELAARWLGFAGIALVLGAGIFLLALRPAISAGVAGPARAGALAVFVSAILLALDQVLSQSRSGLAEALSGIVLSRQGVLVGLRLAAVGIALAALTWMRDGSRTRTGALLTAAGSLAALAAMLGSHAAAAGEPLGMANDLLHIVAMSAWAGGLVCLASVALLRRRARSAEPLGALVWRFSLLALVSVGLIVATGTVAAVSRLRLIEDLYETPYGLALAAKVVLLAIALGLGARNLLVHGARLRRGEAITRAARSLRRNSLAEIALVGAILVGTAFLTALVPPAQAATAPIDQIQRIDGLRVGIKVASTLPGRNRYQVTVTEGLQPARDVERVLLRFTMQTMDMGEAELEAIQRRPGEWVAEGSATSMYGPWNAQVIVRRTDRDDLRGVFTLPLVPPAGGAAAARVIRAAPYTLVVFTDPPEPVSGAPFAISIVVADEKGLAVTDASVRGSLQGPEPLELVTASASAGRYAFPIRGLPTGVYTAAIEIVRAGASVRSSFVLEVAR